MKGMTKWALIGFGTLLFLGILIGMLFLSNEARSSTISTINWTITSVDCDTFQEKDDWFGFSEPENSGGTRGICFNVTNKYSAKQTIDAGVEFQNLNISLKKFAVLRNQTYDIVNNIFTQNSTCLNWSNSTTANSTQENTCTKYGGSWDNTTTTKWRYYWKDFFLNETQKDSDLKYKLKSIKVNKSGTQGDTETVLFNFAKQNNNDKGRFKFDIFIADILNSEINTTLDPFFSTSETNRLNITLNVPSTTITSFSNEPYVISPINFTGSFNTSQLISAGNMTSGCFDLDISNSSNTAINYQWGSYPNSTNLVASYGCGSLNSTTIYINSTLTTTNASNIVTANFNNAGDSTLSNATLGVGNNTARAGLVLFTFAKGNTSDIFDSNGGTINNIAISSGSRTEVVGIFDSADSIGAGVNYNSRDESQFDWTLGNGMTVFAVVKMGGTDGNNFISKSSGGTSGWAIDHNTATTLRLFSGDGAGANSAGLSVTNGNWYYLFMTADASNNILYVFDNTSFIGNVSNAKGITNNDANFQIGGINVGITVDSLIIYARALTGNDINATWTRWARFSDLYSQTYIESQNLAPIIGNLTEPSGDPITYSPTGQATFRTNVREPESAIGTVLFQINGTNFTATNQTGMVMNGTTSTYEINLTLLNVTGSPHTYVWYANDTSSNNAVSQSGTYTINSSRPYLNISNTTSGATSLNTSNLVLYLPFENESSAGNIAIDYSGYDNNGTLTSMNNSGNSSSGWTSSGRLGGALIFDGVDDYVDAGTPASLNFNNSNNFTVMFWANLGQNTSSFYDPFSFGHDGTRGFVFQGSGVSLSVHTGNGTLFTTTFDIDVRDTGWQHLTAVKDTNGVTLYRNGLQVAQNTNFKTNVLFLSNWGVRIGRDTTTGRNVNGTIDEVMIWNRSLTSNEILMLNGSRVTYPTTTNFTGINNITQGTQQLFRNTTSIGTGNSSNSISLGSGLHYYTYNSTLSQNYTRMAIRIPLTVDTATPELNVFIRNASTNLTTTYPNIAELRANSSSISPTFNFYRNSTLIGSGNASENSILGSGIYQLIYNTSGNANFSSRQNATIFLTVNNRSAVRILNDATDNASSHNTESLIDIDARWFVDVLSPPNLINLSYYTLSWNTSDTNNDNISDSWTNVSWTAFASGNNSWTNITRAIPPQAEGLVIGWRIYANGTVTANTTNPEENVTQILGFSVNNQAPSISNPTVTGGCLTVNDPVTVSWSQSDNNALNASFCTFTNTSNPGVKSNTSSTTTAIGAAFCSRTLPEVGTWLVDIIIQDRANNTATTSFSKAVSSACSSEQQQSGGGGGGGGAGVPTVASYNITIKQCLQGYFYNTTSLNCELKPITPSSVPILQAEKGLSQPITLSFGGRKYISPAFVTPITAAIAASGLILAGKFASAKSAKMFRLKHLVKTRKIK